jgi:hypothetical protein
MRTGELPHHDHGHVDGIEEEQPLEPGRQATRTICIRMDDDLHPRETGRGGTEMNTIIIFGLLVVLMLTGMPISISLGLTVLSFLFT